MFNCTILRVYCNSGFYIVSPEHHDLIARAVDDYILDKEDSVIHMPSIGGESIYIRASSITDWSIATPEQRAAEIEISRQLRAENDDNNLPWER